MQKKHQKNINGLLAKIQKDSDNLKAINDLENSKPNKFKINTKKKDIIYDLRLSGLKYDKDKGGTSLSDSLSIGLEYFDYVPAQEKIIQEKTNFTELGEKFFIGQEIKFCELAKRTTSLGQKIIFYSLMLIMFGFFAIYPTESGKSMVFLMNLSFIYFSYFRLKLFAQAKLLNFIDRLPIMNSDGTYEDKEYQSGGKDFDFSAHSSDNLKNYRDIEEVKFPTYTIMLPLYREEKIVISTLVKNIENIKYCKNKLKVLILIENHDQQTINFLAETILPNNFEIITVPPGYPQTKARACNYGLQFVQSQYLVIYDAEDRPDALQLRKSVDYFNAYAEKQKKNKFSASRLVCLQAYLNFFNEDESIITKLFSLEYFYWFNYIISSLSYCKALIPLGGTSNHFKVDFLKQIGGWDSYNVTEDADLGVRIVQNGGIVQVLQSYTMEEAPITVKAWLNQRSRWIKGYIQTFLVHMRQPFKIKQNLGSIFNIQLFLNIIGGTAILPVLNCLQLIIWVFWGNYDVYYISYLAFGLWYTGVLWVLYCIQIKLKKFRIIPLLLVIFYYILYIIAGIMALYSLIKKPHSWNKTDHGSSKSYYDIK